MLSNKTQSEIQESIIYVNNQLKISKNVNIPALKKILEKDLKSYIDKLEEAKSRIIVGYDVEDNAKVYVAPSCIEGAISLWVEGKPSGWDVAKFNIVINGTREVVYDGGTKWIGKLKFTSTFTSTLKIVE